MPRPNIQPMTDELMDLIYTWRKKHEAELEVIGEVNVSILALQHTVTWDKTKVYDPCLPPEQRYKF